MAQTPAALDKIYKQRRLSPRYDDIIYTLDLDKTYLATEFETLSGLVKIPFEGAEDKRNIPGVAALVRELRRGIKEDAEPVPLFFISGSPRQLERVVREKFRLDGVSVDGILFKEWVGAIKKFKFKMIVDKIGFKLNALLHARSIFPRKANEILFGDDSEYDAAIYSLYSDIISGRLEDFEVLTILKRWQVDPGEIDAIEKSLERLRKSGWRPRDAVQRIFIHMETGSKPEDYHGLSPRVTATNSYFQSAVLLYSMDRVTRAGLFRVISDLLRGYQFKMTHFLEQTEDLLNRGLIDRREAKKLVRTVAKRNPLALPIHWLGDIRRDFNNILKSVSDVQKSITPGKGEKSVTVVERYLNYTPSRRV